MLLGYANNVDAMTRVRRGGTHFTWDNFMSHFETDSDGAEDSMTATTTADPFDDSFFNDRLGLLLVDLVRSGLCIRRDKFTEISR